MRALIIMGPGAVLDNNLIANALKEEIKVNSYPKDEGIAVFDCGKEPDWSWADYTIVAGECDIGRRHFDLKIAKGDDATSQIIETLSVLAESNPAEDGDNA